MPETPANVELIYESEKSEPSQGKKSLTGRKRSGSRSRKHDYGIREAKDLSDKVYVGQRKATFDMVSDGAPDEQKQHDVRSNQSSFRKSRVSKFTLRKERSPIAPDISRARVNTLWVSRERDFLARKDLGISGEKRAVTASDGHSSMEEPNFAIEKISEIPSVFGGKLILARKSATLPQNALKKLDERKFA
jgi:hypothetical protein